MTYAKPLILGFLFGTAGMYLLAMLSLMFQPVEVLTGFLFAPGRFISATFVGSEGSNAAVVLLTLFNGALYAGVFALLSYLNRLRQR